MNVFASVSVDEMTANILTAWRASDAHCRHQGATWYPRAHAYVRALADYSGLDVAQTAAIVAMLSPRTPWARNKVNAAALLVEAGHLAPADAVKVLAESGTAASADDVWEPRGLPNNIRKARLVANGGNTATLVTGQKVTSFYYNILDPWNSDDVTVDAWSAGVAVGRRLANAELSGLTAVQYQRVALAYTFAGVKLGKLPSTVQATGWCWARNQTGYGHDRHQ
jgi:hypothetical protein